MSAIGACPPVHQRPVQIGSHPHLWIITYGSRLRLSRLDGSLVAVLVAAGDGVQYLVGSGIPSVSLLVQFQSTVSSQDIVWQLTSYGQHQKTSTTPQWRPCSGLDQATGFQQPCHQHQHLTPACTDIAAVISGTAV